MSRDPLLGDEQTQASRLNRHLSFGFRVASWFVATGLFFLCFAFCYAGSNRDVYETSVPTFAMMNGEFQCAYPVGAWSAVPPLMPAIDAGVLTIAKANLNGLVHYQLVNGKCHAVNPKKGSVFPLVLVGLMAWPILVAAFILVLVAVGKAATRWESVGLCLLGATPLIPSALVSYFHPEDICSMALILAGVACAIRSRWLAAGVCIGIACCFKQFALLPTVPLIIAAGRDRRRFILGALSSMAFILVPLCSLLGKGALAVIAGRDTTPSTVGNAFIGGLHLHGVALFAASRALPFVTIATVALWARARLGSAIRRPEALFGLVAVSLVARLIFEVSLFTYYFMATAVALVVLDIVRGRVRLETIAWIISVSAFYSPRFDPLTLFVTRHPWMAQFVLVAPAMLLAGWPLYEAVRKHTKLSTMTPRVTVPTLDPLATPTHGLKPESP